VKVTRGVAVGIGLAMVAMIAGATLVLRPDARRSSVTVAAADELPASFHVSATYDGPSNYTIATDRCVQVDTVWDATVEVSSGETWQYHNEYCGTVANGEFNGAGPFSFTVPNGDRLFGTRRVTHAPYPGTGGGTNLLHITGGTGQFRGASGSCVMDNHHDDFDNGRQQQSGTLECGITAPARSASAAPVRLTGDYDGRSNFTLATGRCEMVDTVWDASFDVSNGETWQYHNDYCGTLIDFTFDGHGTFTFTAPNDDTITGTTDTIDVPVLDPADRGGTGGPTYLTVSGGTGTYAGSGGSCVLDNHVQNKVDGVFGHQRQWGTFECELDVPSLASPAVDETTTTSTTEPASTTTTDTTVATDPSSIDSSSTEDSTTTTVVESDPASSG